MFKAELDAKEGKTDRYEKKNVEFEYQSHMGTATGRLKSRKYVRDAIAQFYEDQEKMSPETECYTVQSPGDLEMLAKEKRDG